MWMRENERGESFLYMPGIRVQFTLVGEASVIKSYKFAGVNITKREYKQV